MSDDLFDMYELMFSYWPFFLSEILMFFAVEKRTKEKIIMLGMIFTILYQLYFFNDIWYDQFDIRYLGVFDVQCLDVFEVYGSEQI